MAIDQGSQRALSLADAGIYLGGVSHQTIYRLVHSGQLRSFRIGKRRYFLIEELDRFIDDQMSLETETEES